MVRPSVLDRNGMRKGAWSKEEDDKLRAYILRYGHWNWRLLPRFAGLARDGKSCRLRWVNYLKPGLKRGNFTKEEENLIMELHNQMGNKWSAIAAKLPGRTDNEVKNYWHTHVKKRRKSATNKKQTSTKDTAFEIETLKGTGSSCGISPRTASTNSAYISSDSAASPGCDDDFWTETLFPPILTYNNINQVNSLPLVLDSLELLSPDFPASASNDVFGDDSANSSDLVGAEVQGSFWTDQPFSLGTFSSEDGHFLPGPFSPHVPYFDDFISSLFQ